MQSYLLHIGRSPFFSVLISGALLVWAVPAWPHGGNTDPTAIHACVGNFTKVVRIVGVDGHCQTKPPALAETAVHWPGVGSIGSGSNLATEIVGTWTGSRFNQDAPFTGVLVESPVTFTFNADGTFLAAGFTLDAGEYKVVGSSLIVGPASFHDVRIQGNTLTFGSNNVYSGATIINGIGAVYHLTRQP